MEKILISKEYLDDKDRINPEKFDEILYIGDGVNCGYRYMITEQ